MIKNRYVEILFDFAEKHNQINEINEQFEELVYLFTKFPQWKEVILLPTIPVAEKYKLIESLNVFDKFFLTFIASLINNNHLFYVNSIHELWKQKYHLSQKIAYIQLYSSVVPSKKLEEKIIEEIQPYFSSLEVKINVIIDKSLIKGLRLTYQGFSLDNSVSKELEKIKSFV